MYDSSITPKFVKVTDKEETRIRRALKQVEQEERQ